MNWLNLAQPAKNLSASVTGNKEPVMNELDTEIWMFLQLLLPNSRKITSSSISS